MNGMVAADELGPCPSCGKPLSFGDALENGQRVPVLLHPLPMCSYFRVTAIQDIVVAMRVAASRN